MKATILTKRTWTLLIAAALLVVAGALNFQQRLTHIPPPTDGVFWTETGKGVVAAKDVAPGSAGRRGDIHVGDRLIAISEMTGDRLDPNAGEGERHFQPIERASDIQIYLERAGVGGGLTYFYERPTNPEASRFYYADIDNLQPTVNQTKRDFYLQMVGVLWLCVGLFVLFKQGGRTPFVTHFAALSLAAFVFHVFKPVGTYEDFDAAIAFLDDAALLIFAPLFMHFCALYPVRSHLPHEKRWRRLLLLYVPAFVLIGLTATLYFASVPTATRVWQAFGSEVSAGSLETFYRLRFAHFIIGLVVGTGLLVRRFLQTKSAIVRQQLKWVVIGSTVAVVPFTLLYGFGYLLGWQAQDWSVAIAVAPLALIPLAFGNSVVRYRLMDVDVVVRRAAVYALTTLMIAALIGATVLFTVRYALGGENIGAIADDGLSFRLVFSVVLMAFIVMLAAPVKNWLQERTDRVFYGERYDMRKSLLDFGRTLSAATSFDDLLNALISRLQQVLNVGRVAIFLEDAKAANGYRLARAVGFETALRVPADFREMIRARSAETGIVRADDLETGIDDSGGFVRRSLHYYVPCVVRGRMIAVIGLGRSADGALLSSEDVEILRTVSGYVAVAIENSLLYNEQKERAIELEALKEFNDSIIESTSVGLLAVDLQGRVTHCNPALEEMLDITREAAIGKPVKELFALNFAAALERFIGEEGWHFDGLRNLYKLHTGTRAGKPLILNLALAPLRAEGMGRTGALVVIEDVTARLSLEEQLQQREKLSSIGLLAAGVAHEVNTPLTGISSYTQMLLGMIPDTDPKHALLQKVHRQVDRATNIVTNLLNFSRTGNATEFNALDVNRVLDDTLQLLEPQMRRSQITVEREYATNLAPAYGNAGKLQQVFTNLILNARDAMPDGGTLTLKTFYATEEDSVIIAVGDTGSGIEAENLSKIFDPFFTTKGVGRGTGLGLAVSYGIMQEHDGDISVVSSPGEGTTFRVVLPSAHARTNVAHLQAAGD